MKPAPPCPVMAEIRKILANPAGMTREARILLIMAYRAQRTHNKA